MFPFYMHVKNVLLMRILHKLFEDGTYYITIEVYRSLKQDIFGLQNIDEYIMEIHFVHN